MKLESGGARKSQSGCTTLREKTHEARSEDASLTASGQRERKLTLVTREHNHYGLSVAPNDARDDQKIAPRKSHGPG